MIFHFFFVRSATPKATGSGPVIMSPFHEVQEYLAEARDYSEKLGEKIAVRNFFFIFFTFYI